jgi:hypothetical protein
MTVRQAIGRRKAQIGEREVVDAPAPWSRKRHADCRPLDTTTLTEWRLLRSLVGMFGCCGGWSGAAAGRIIWIYWKRPGRPPTAIRRRR